MPYAPSFFFALDINAFDGFALYYASANCPPEIVRIALDLGADVHANGDLALFSAVVKGRKENVKILLDHGASTKTDAAILLSIALDENHIDMAKTLTKGLHIKLKCRMPWTYISKGYSKESLKFINQMLKGVPYNCPKVKSRK